MEDERVKELEARLELLTSGFPESSFKWRWAKAQEEVERLNNKIYALTKVYLEGKQKVEAKATRYEEALKEIKSVGTKGAMHIGDTGYYTQECTIAMKALTEGGAHDA